MKAIPFIITPTILLIIGCIIISASWPYYIIAWAAGNGLGMLAFLTWLQIKDSSNEPKIKFDEGNN